MSDAREKYRWKITGAGAWSTWNSHKTYSATIAYGSGVYTLVISPGSVTTTHTSLKAAKGTFRKYLHTK